MGHDEGQGGGHDEAAEVDEARSLAHQHEHFVGQPLGQPGLREDHTDDDRSEYEPDRRVHELLEGQLRAADRSMAANQHDVGTDQKQHLDDGDRDAGDADRNHLEDPPHRGQEKQPERRLALLAELEGFPHRVDGIRPRRRQINGEEQRYPKKDEEQALPVNGSFGFSPKSDCPAAAGFRLSVWSDGGHGFRHHRRPCHCWSRGAVRTP